MDKSIKGIIFDFNGTLFNDTELHNQAWKRFAGMHGKELTSLELAHKVHGSTNREIIKYLLEDQYNDQHLGTWYEEKESIYRNICLRNQEKLRLTPGAVQFLDHLSEIGCPRTIATASYRRNVAFYFDIFNLGRWFDFDKVVYDTGEFRGKPHPDLFLAATCHLGLTCSTCMIIEDSLSGLQAAANADAGSVVAVDFGFLSAKARHFPFVDQIVDDFRKIELKGW